MSIESAVQFASSGQDVPQQLMVRCIEEMLLGRTQPDQTLRFLVALHEKGESIGELTGAALAMRAAMSSIQTHHPIVLDTCGTGGDGAKTFNISTAAAIVCAAAGVPVAKHGNRKITSRTGSADVLAELGINLEAPREIVERCLNELGLCFCFAPLFHSAMRHVADVRRKISHPTIFNRLGPLCNPASANRQVLGVGDPLLQSKLANTLRALGTERAIVVRGEDGVDEISLSADTSVLEVSPAGIQEYRWRTSDFGVQEQDRALLFADSPAESAECIREVLSGRPGARRDVVLLNAAAGIWVADNHCDLRTAFTRAAEALDSGRAAGLVERLGQMTRSI